MTTPNIDGHSVLNFVDVTRLAPRGLRWPLGFYAKFEDHCPIKIRFVLEQQLLMA